MTRSGSANSSLFASFFFSLLAVALTACSGGGGSGSAPPSLKSISVTPGAPSVAAGLTQQFRASGSYSDGTNIDLTSSVTWTSATPGVVTINASGLATSKTQGTSVITATSGSVSGSATLNVGPATLASISVIPATIQLGATAQMQATGIFTDQSTQDLTNSVTWAAANGYVVNVGGSGDVTSLAPGSSAITATQGGIQGSAPVTVLASPRYLYVAALAGRTLTRLAVDSKTGQPRFDGYSSSLVTGNIGFPCLTVDPSGTHAYLATQVSASGGSGYAGTVGIYSIDPPSGMLTPVPGSPFPVSFALGCIRFDPSGKFAYAISGIENAGDQLGVFSVNSNDGSLTLSNTISFPETPTSVAVDPVGQYLYVATLKSPYDTTSAGFLYGYSIDATMGSLTALSGSPWSLAAGTWGELAFHPSGDFLYISDHNATKITEFTVNRSTGVPTQAGIVDSTCINPSALEFLPNGSHAYTLCGESSSGSVLNAPVVEFLAGENGQLTAHSTASAGANALQMQVDEAGQFLYVLGSGSDTAAAGSNSYNALANVVLAFQVQPDGSLKLGKQIAGHVLENSMVLLSGPAPVTWTTKSAFVTTSGDNKLTPFSVATDGTLTSGTSQTTQSGPFSASMLPWGSDLLFATQTAAPNLYGLATWAGSIGSGSSFGSAAAAGGIVISPDGNWGYATDPASGVVDGFHREIPGYWTAAGTFAAQAGAGPVTMDPSGRYIVVANQTAKSISLIEPLGAAPTPPTSLSFTPLTVTVDGTGNLIFVAGDDGELHMYLSNGLGTLTDVSDVSLLGTNTASVAVDPLSRFVYAAGPGGLNAFAIDATAGTLTPISMSLGVSLQSATGVYIDPSGQYLYVPVSSGTTTNALYLFTINADGTLTAGSANPVAAPNHATSMVFQTTIQ